LSQDFRELQVWQRAHGLALSVYRVTASFPKEELYGLTSQIRRAASSITANLAEGCGRGGRSEIARFAQIARGSASELECHLLLARDLGHLSAPDYQRLYTSLAEVERMLTAFRQTLMTRAKSPAHDSRLTTHD
jgi:four helix bundle protein